MITRPVELDTDLDIHDLTHASVDGNGAFDVLMRSVKAHIQQEWDANRIKGNEYSALYLGALQSAMQFAMQYVLSEAKTNAEVAILKQQLENLKIEGDNAVKQGNLLDKQVLDMIAATDLKVQQAANLAAEALNIPKQGAVLDAQAAKLLKDVALADEEILIAQQKVLISQAELGIAQAKLVNIPKEGALLDAQAAKTLADIDLAIRQLALLEQQKLNAEVENTLIAANKLKADAEKLFIEQKTVTEKANTDASVLGVDSLLAKQANVYQNQADGYLRDAEQKAAKIMIDHGSVRVTNDLEFNSDTALLHSPSVGAVVARLKAGIGA
jgi:hypothetical protein